MIVVAGEALIDLMPSSGAERQFEAWPGGAPANVAVGLARLGREASFLGRISGDPFGQLLRQHLEHAGVDLSMVIRAAQPTTLAVAAVDGHGKAEYTFYAQGTADWQWAEPEVPRVLPGAPRALYVGGLALREPPGAAMLEDLMRRTWREDQTLVFFDPNVRTGLSFTAEAERARVERQLRLAHVIKASQDDVTVLYPGRDYREVAAVWQAMTSGLVAVTLGADGVYALGPESLEVTVPGVPIQVVDTVGAGDAFAAAMLDSLIGLLPAGIDPGDALPGLGAPALRGLLERACVCAALTCEQVGAQSPDAPTLDEATARMRRTRYGPATGFEPAIPGV
jgi:fructokinase